MCKNPFLAVNQSEKSLKISLQKGIKLFLIKNFVQRYLFVNLQSLSERCVTHFFNKRGWFFKIKNITPYK
jgi:hypothetical protein